MSLILVSPLHSPIQNGLHLVILSADTGMYTMMAMHVPQPLCIIGQQVGLLGLYQRAMPVLH